MSDFIKRFYLNLRYQPVVLYIVGVVAAFLTEQVLANLNRQRGTAFTLAVALGLLAIGWLIYSAGLWLFRRFLVPTPIPMGDKPDHHRALIIVLGGHSDESAPVAINHHKPELERIWLIYTDFTKKISETLEAQFRDIRCVPILLEDHYRPEHAASAVRQALEHARAMAIPAQDVICDLTGGTAAMTFGAFQACLAEGIAVQMVAAQYNLVSGEVEHAHDVISLQAANTS